MDKFKMLSPTSIETYAGCPKRFGLRYREWAKEPVGQHMVVGRFVQDAIEAVLRSDMDPEISDGEAEAIAMRRASEQAGKAAAAMDREVREHPGIISDTGSRLMGMIGKWVSAGVAMHISLLRSFGHHGLARDWSVMRPKMFGPDEYLVAPEGTYRGKPDLLYPMPDGDPLIVDVKIGSGADPARREAAVKQLQVYSLLHRELYGPCEAEVWYLGTTETVSVPQWLPAEADAFRDTVDAIHADQVLRATPGPVCDDCGIRDVCSDSPHRIPLPPLGDPFGPAPEFTARCLGIGDLKQATGKRRVTIGNDLGVWSYGVPDDIACRMRPGRDYRLWCRVWNSRHMGRQLDFLNVQPMADWLAETQGGETTPPIYPENEA